MTFTLAEVDLERERLNFPLEALDLYLEIEVRLEDDTLDVPFGPMFGAIRPSRPVAHMAVYRGRRGLGPLRAPGSGLGRSDDLLWHHDPPYGELVLWLRGLREVIEKGWRVDEWTGRIHDLVRRTVDGTAYEQGLPGIGPGPTQRQEGGPHV